MHSSKPDRFPKLFRITLALDLDRRGSALDLGKVCLRQDDFGRTDVFLKAVVSGIGTIHGF